MGILRERVVRGRTRQDREPRGFQLTSTEAANVKVALLHLRAQHGCWREVARVMGCTKRALEKAAETRRRPSPGLALHVARALGLPVEAMLTGARSEPGSCPMCGRASSRAQLSR
jgi:transcriptional regulator with XRE-family HTH domain